MTTPASGAISMSDLKTEFGGINPVSLSDYYDADFGVPASGILRMSYFYSKKANTKMIVTMGQGISASGATQWGFNTQFYGFGPGVFGSASPISIGGYNVVSAWQQDTPIGSPRYSWYIAIAGTHAQNFFTSALFEDQWPAILTADATYYVQESGYAWWQWTKSTKNTSWDSAGGNKYVRLYL